MTDTETKLADALREAEPALWLMAASGNQDAARIHKTVLDALAAHDTARAQPASESKPIGFILRDVNEPRDYYPDTFVLDEPQEDETDEQHWEPVYAEATPAQPASVAAGLPEPRLWITGTLTKRSEIVGFLRDEAVEREAEDRDVGIAPDHEGARLLAAVADALASDVLWSVAAAPRPPQPASAPDGQKPVVHCDRIDGIEHCLGDTQVAHLSGVHGHPRLGDIPYARTSRIVSIETKNTVYVIGNGAAPQPAKSECNRNCDCVGECKAGVE